MTDPVVSDAISAEILGKLGRFRLGLEKSAIHEMLTVSTSMEETLAALCRLRKDGKVESDDAGRYYLRSASIQQVSKQYPESIHQRGRRGVVKPSGAGRQLIASLSRPMNTRQLAAASKLTPKQVNNHIFFLRRDGLVDGVLSGVGAKKIWSRTPAGEEYVKGLAVAPGATR